MRVTLHVNFTCRNKLFCFGVGGGRQMYANIKYWVLTKFKFLNENKYKIFQSIILLSTCHPVNFGSIQHCTGPCAKFDPESSSGNSSDCRWYPKIIFIIGIQNKQTVSHGRPFIKRGPEFNALCVWPPWSRECVLSDDPRFTYMTKI